MKARGRILIMSSPVLITALLAAMACTSGPAAADTVWGNERETFTILPDGARFEGLCLEGMIPEKVVVDDAGTFSARGTLRHVGGARRDDNAPRAVVFHGTIRGDTMTLSIDDGTVVNSTLRKGVHGTTHPCA